MRNGKNEEGLNKERPAATKNGEKTKVLAELEAVAPPRDAIETLADNLGYLILRKAERRMGAITDKNIQQALEGNIQAAKVIYGFVGALMSRPQSGAGARKNQEERDVRDELCERLAIVLFYGPPAHEIPLYHAAGGPIPGAQVPDVVKALQASPWFEHESDGWHLTAEGRAELERRGLTTPRPE